MSAHTLRGVVLGGLALILSALSSVALAQPRLGGDLARIPPPASVSPVRWPDVAYDPSSGVFLAVFGATRIGAVRFDATGMPLGPAFVVDAGSAYAQAPRVAPLPGGGFVVAWHGDAGGGTRVRARRVASDGTPAGAEVDVSPPGSNWEMGAALAVAPDGTVLVSWQSTADQRIYAQRLDGAGAPVGGVVAVDDRPLYFRDPSVAFFGAAGAFVVGYGGCVADRDCFAAARIVGTDGLVVGAPILFAEHRSAVYVPELAYVEDEGRMLAVWHEPDAPASFVARVIEASGALGPRVLVTDTVGSYDACGVAYARGSRTVLFVSHGRGAEDVAIELDGGGSPLGSIPFGDAATTGNFNPRVAAADDGWLAVTSQAFGTLVAQRIVSTRAVDGGVAIADGGVLDAARADAATVDAAATGADARGLDAGPTRGGSSCRCRAQRDASGRGPVAAALGIALVLLVRARSGRSRPR